METKDFFRVLHEKGLKDNAEEYDNLRQFLQLGENRKDLISVKRLRKSLEQMHSNEEFLTALHDDMLMEDVEDRERQREEDALRRIEAGMSPG